MVILASIHQSKESLLKTISVDNFKNLKKISFLEHSWHILIKHTTSQRKMYSFGI